MATFAVTGAFGFSGRHIAKRLLGRGDIVRNLTNHPDRPDPFDGRVACAALDLDDLPALVRALAGVDVLINTYWVRYDHGGADHALAVERSRRLFQAADRAGVDRIVHVSIANPSPTSRLSYYRGKAAVEAALAAAGPSHGILRPTVLFGDNPILPNTIAYLLRRLPVFGIPGDGRYGIQPVAVEDLADLAVALAYEGTNRTIDAVGPEVYSFREFVTVIRDAIGSHATLLPTPAPIALAAASVLGRALGDVILTREELDGLMAGLLVSHRPPTGHVRFSDWLARNADWLGRQHLSEVGLHFDSPAPRCRLAARYSERDQPADGASHRSRPAPEPRHGPGGHPRTDSGSRPSIRGRPGRHHLRGQTARRPRRRMHDRRGCDRCRRGRLHGVPGRALALGAIARATVGPCFRAAARTEP